MLSSLALNFLIHAIWLVEWWSELGLVGPSEVALARYHGSLAVLASPELEAICTIPYLRVDIPHKMKGQAFLLSWYRETESLQKVILRISLA